MTVLRLLFGGPAHRRATSVIAAVVIVVALTILTIGARSPYTHANLQPDYDPSYTRTEPSFVGPSAPYRDIPGAAALRVPDDPAATGARLFVAKGCAGCHALEGVGAAAGPQLARLTLSVLQKSTRRGPAGMPSYSREALDDEGLLAIIGYLRSLREVSPLQTGGGQGFRDVVLPLLQQTCSSCHALRGKAGFSVVDRGSLLRGGESGPAVVPWDAKASLLIQKLRPSPPFGEIMPPDEPPLDEEVIERIVQWIERGAPDD